MVPRLAVLCLAAVGLAVPTFHQANGAPTELDLVKHVDPFIGTDDSTSPDPVPHGAGGSTFPGAVYPFGMVQFSPDTPTASPSGYRRSDKDIEHFSLTHFNGAGCANNENIQIMPSVGGVVDSTSSPGTHWRNFRSPKSDEVASPGYYGTTLGNSTKVELTASRRTGAVRLTFPASNAARLLVNTSDNAGASSALSDVTVDGNEISGTTTGGDFCTPLNEAPNRFKIHFVLRFDRTPTGIGTWSGDTVNNATSGELKAGGTNTGAFVTFDTNANQTVGVRVGLSFVSVDGARHNLDQEQPANTSFGTVQAAARHAWNTRLGSIQVGGGDAGDLTRFYTALYHVMQAPNIASDLPYTDARGRRVDARYVGFDGRAHSVPVGMTAVYQNYSGWDVYRSWTALASLVAPDVMTDVVKSMILSGEQGGLLPNWSQQSTETYAMPGDAGPILVASAHAFGVRDFDTAAALELMKKNANGSAYSYWQRGDELSWYRLSRIRDSAYDYKTNGYVPGKPSLSLEYAASDFAIAQFAKALNDSSSSDYMQRAQWWVKNFDTRTGYVRPRWPDGWATPFKPDDHNGFTEGNAAQYTWMIPFNYRSLFDLMGGSQKAVERLDNHFSQLNAGISKPYFYIGNEPQHGVPWAYHFAGAPAKTSAVVRRVMNEFTTGPGGLPGNDDLGATSAWYVWAALGMYPTTPGADTLALHGPMFSSVLIHRTGGDIRITGGGKDQQYVRSVTLDGTAVTRNHISYQEIAQGGALTFSMGMSPSTWGTGAADAPPSFTDGFTASNPRPPGTPDPSPAPPATPPNPPAPAPEPPAAPSDHLKGGGRCLDTSAGSFFDGTAVVVANCVPGSASQTWLLAENATLEALGMCMTVVDAGGGGKVVELQQCRPRGEQVWTLDAQGRLVNQPSRTCLTVPPERSPGAGPSGQLVMRPCSDPGVTRWTWSS